MSVIDGVDHALGRWITNLVPASFRGVPFLYEKVEGEIGRRTVLKQYPGRDEPNVQDLGRAPRKFSLDMFLIGENYMFYRDRLRLALEKAGAGQLNHPYWGPMSVKLLGTARFVETTKDGGMVKITATFVQNKGELSGVAYVANPVSAVATAAEAVTAAMQDAFAAAFTVANTITSVANAAISVVQSVSAAVNSIRGQIASALLVVSNAEDALNSLSSNAASLIQTPVTLAQTLSGAFSTVVSDITNESAAFDAAVAFYGSEESLPAAGNVLSTDTQVGVLGNTIAGFLGLDLLYPTIINNTAQQRTIRNNNQRALSRLVRASAITSIAACAVQLTYSSLQQAQTTSAAALALVDDLLTDDNLEDEVYGPLADLRAALAAFFTSTADALPALVTYVPQVALPALVIAYQLYGDATFDADIIARNPLIQDPSSVPGGQPLQVLASE